MHDKLFVDMRLKSLSLKNMRLFGEAEQTINFREDKNKFQNQEKCCRTTLP